MDLTFSKELAQIPDLRHQVRSLHSFRSSFTRGAALVAGHMSASVEVDQARCTMAFLNWAEKFTRQRQYSTQDRQDFCIFSCGLLLAELMRSDPLRVTLEPNERGGGTLPARSLAIARFWPGGFLLTSYCSSVLDAILQQDFRSSITFSPLAEDLRTWWSFRENTREDPSEAIAFFDLFVGREPNWRQPEAFQQRSASTHSARPALQ